MGIQAQLATPAASRHCLPPPGTPGSRQSTSPWNCPACGLHPQAKRSGVSGTRAQLADRSGPPLAAPQAGAQARALAKCCCPALEPMGRWAGPRGDLEGPLPRPPWLPPPTTSGGLLQPLTAGPPLLRAVDAGVPRSRGLGPQRPSPVHLTCRLLPRPWGLLTLPHPLLCFGFPHRSYCLLD